MKAMQLERLGTIQRDSTPLTAVEVDRPEPGADEVLLRVHTCGVCHTELDEIEGRLPPPALPVIPGHQVVGEVVRAPDDAFVQPGDYAEYMTVPAAYAIPVPPALSDEGCAPGAATGQGVVSQFTDLCLRPFIGDPGFCHRAWRGLEREVKSIANITRADIAELLPIAAENNIHAKIDVFGLDDANRALTALKFDATVGAKVLRIL